MKLINRDIQLQDGRTAVNVLGEIQVGTYGLFDQYSVEAPVIIGRAELDVGMIGAFTGIK